MSFTNFSTGKSHSFGGKYVELTPHERIRHTDKFDDPNLPGEMQTTITLEKVSCGTELNITQEGVPAVIPPEACYLGWQESLMKKLIVALLSAAGIALGSASAADSSNAAKGEKKEAVTEALVRQRVEDWAKAVRAKDIDGVMSLYATNNVSFDLDPPLRYAGADNKRRAWQEFFAARTGPIDLQAFRADEGGTSMESRIRNERDNHRPNERRKR